MPRTVTNYGAKGKDLMRQLDMGAIEVFPTVDAEYRTWTDANRKYETRAKFAGLVWGTVVLQLESEDKAVKVPIQHLSKEDQEYIDKKRVLEGP